jgi:hypothetical protein
MFSSQLRSAAGVVCLVALSSLVAYQSDAPRPGHLADPFSAGWMLADTNGDDLVDFIAGKVVVPAYPTAAENAAAAEVAARLGYATTGFTPPVVISPPKIARTVLVSTLDAVRHRQNTRPSLPSNPIACSRAKAASSR